MKTALSELKMPLCSCFRSKDSQKEKEDVLNRIHVVLIHLETKPGYIIDNSEVFGPCDPFHKISVEKLGLWAVRNYIKYENDESEIREKCYDIIHDLYGTDIYLKV